MPNDQTNAYATPQPNRANDPSLRNTWESEEWDDIANVVYTSNTDSLTVPCPLICRLEIHAVANILGAGDLLITVDGTAQPFDPQSAVAGFICNIAAVDVLAGVHTVSISSTGFLDTQIIMVRRGRKPPG